MVDTGDWLPWGKMYSVFGAFRPDSWQTKHSVHTWLFIGGRFDEAWGIHTYIQLACMCIEINIDEWLMVIKLKYNYSDRQNIEIWGTYLST